MSAQPDFNAANDPDTLARVAERFLNGIEVDNWQAAEQPSPSARF